GFHESLVEAESMVLHLRTRLLPAIEHRGLLRINQAHTRQRSLVPQISLVPVMPAVHFLHCVQPATVDDLAVEFRKPGPQIVRDSVDHPEPDLVTILHGILPAIRLFKAHAEDAYDGFAAHGRAILFPVLPVGPRRHYSSSGLA